MPFNVPSDIKTQLNNTEIGGIFYLVEIIQENNTRRISERLISVGEEPEAGARRVSETYAFLPSEDGFVYQVDDEQPGVLHKVDRDTMTSTDSLNLTVDVVGGMCEDDTYIYCFGYNVSDNFEAACRVLKADFTTIDTLALPDKNFVRGVSIDVSGGYIYYIPRSNSSGINYSPNIMLRRVLISDFATIEGLTIDDGEPTWSKFANYTKVDGTYVYLTTNLSGFTPFNQYEIFRITKSSFTLADILIVDTGLSTDIASSISDMTQDDNNVYVAFNDFDPFDPVTPSLGITTIEKAGFTVADTDYYTYTPTGTASFVAMSQLANDATHIYASLNNDPGQIAKILKSTMAVSDLITLAEDEDNANLLQLGEAVDGCQEIFVRTLFDESHAFEPKLVKLWYCVPTEEYEPRLLGITGLQSSVQESTTVEIKIANADQEITNWDREESFLGAKVNIYEYVQAVDGTYVGRYLKWSGIADEMTDINWEDATLPAYSGPVTMRLDIPKRFASSQCAHVFGNVPSSTTEIVDSAYTTRNFEGFECPYQRISTVGFVGEVDGTINNSSNPVTFNVVLADSADGAKFARTDYIRIDDEILMVSEIPDDPVADVQEITCVRAQRGTTIASHADEAVVKFADCQRTWEACHRRGMRGNNSADTFSGTSRNYFGGFPLISASTTTGTILYLPRIGRVSTKRTTKVSVAGPESVLGDPIPLVYGNALVTEPILYVVSDQKEYLTTGWLLCEGVLATNNTNDTLNSDRLYAFGGYDGNGGTENIFVNGKRRHDFQANFGIEVWTGDSDRNPPTTAGFFSNVDVPEFSDDKLAFWGTAWLLIKVTKDSNDEVDINSPISGEMEIKYGRIVRVYTDAPTGEQTANDPTLFTRKATTNPAWVLLDVETSKRAGGSADYRSFNIQSFIDLADHCDELVFDTTSPADEVPRFTFNGVINTKRSFQDYERAICLGMYATPPFIGIDGKLRVKALKKENPVSGEVPLFTDNSETVSERNILWENGHSTLSKSRKSILEIPNRIVVNYMFKDADGKFCRTTGMLEDQFIQKKIGEALGDNSIRVVTKTVDLIGTMTDDEAARVATLILNAGEFAAGGLYNNQIIQFKTFYRTSNDLTIGDVIEVESDLLDPAAGEQFYRVVEIKDEQSIVETGGIIFYRTVVATVHTDDLYEDFTGGLTRMTTVSTGTPNDGLAPPVTGASVSAAGAYDANNQPVARLTFTYTNPDPIENFKQVSIWSSPLTTPGSPYNAGSNPATGDWRHIVDINNESAQVDYPISGDYEVFAFVSTNLNGVTPHPDTRNADDSAFFYPRDDVQIQGITDVLPAPTFTVDNANHTITLTIDPYTGDDAILFKHFNIYRHTTSTFGSATLIASISGTTYVDTSAVSNTTYYYWVTGVSFLDVESTEDGPESTSFTFSYTAQYSVTGLPPGNTVIPIVVFPHAVTFPANFAGSVGFCVTNPTDGTAVFTVKKNGSTTIGTVSINTSGVFTFATSGGSAQSFSTSDYMTIVTPNPQDSTLSDVMFTLLGAY